MFLYGDALTVCLHSTLYDKILRKITQSGNEEYVEILLAAQERLFVQKGRFHQQLHLLGVIYTQFYSSFMQAFQVVSGVKRVTGDPVKSGFQCHKMFAIKLFNACNQLMMRRFCISLDCNEINQMDVYSYVHRLRLILSRYQTYRLAWEEGVHKPLLMIALFMKSMQMYLCYKRAISAHDGWHLEIESCKLLLIWKMTGNTNYF